MGVAYLLAYVIGALLITLGANRLLNDIVAGAELMEGLVAFGGGVGIVLAAGLLQAVVIKRRGDAGMLEALPSMGKKGFIIAAAIWLLSIAWPWIQFELYWNPVDIYPLITLAGASALVFGVAQRISEKSKYRNSLATMAVAIVGVPLGLLSVALPTAHFNYHLTHVQTTTSSTGEGIQEHTFFADDPRFLDQETNIMSEETAELFNSLAEARPVDIDAEIEAGRMKRLADGTVVILDREGIGGPAQHEDVGKLVDDALEKDARAAAEQKARARAKFEAELEARRRGGRIFRR